MIGIVLASAFGFVGVVVGIMAAMGKFKTPVVYPTVLNFTITEQTVIEKIPYETNTEILTWEEQFANKNTAPSIFSFMLSGTNPDSEYEVNQKSCYLWFDDSASAKLITLCDANGRPLSKNSNNRYLVNCNEPIYYMINKLKADDVTDGKVVLQARSTNDTLKKPDSPMIIWIDRVADEIFVANRGIPSIEDGKNQQSISVGVDMSFDFDYVVGIDDETTSENEAIDEENALVLKPISKESAKEIELYYVATGYSDDYIKVTEEEVNDVNSPLNSILTYSDGVFSFKSSVAGTYTFKIAVFKTYEYKTNYL